MTRPFLINQLRENTVADIRALWSVIDLKPSYQRQSDIWQRDKRQLFIDSLINGYDIPKLYFHDLSWNNRGASKRYAIIDGKQRLEAINAFVNGEFPLSDDFEDVEHEGTDRAGAAARMRYAQLASAHPNLKARLDGARLPIVLIQTAGSSAQDLEAIEEMFSRLNEAVPLNAPEKRNALGGPLPKQIRRLALAPFFLTCLGFPNYRYRHLDLATKFLYIEHRNGLTDLKKRDLDSFVKEFKSRRLERESAELYLSSSQVLNHMSRKFDETDYLLASVGMVTVYYFLFRHAAREHWLNKISRDSFVAFDRERAENRARIRQAELAVEAGRTPPTVNANPVLAAFERYAQSPNDATALTRRYQVLRRFVLDGAMPASE